MILTVNERTNEITLLYHEIHGEYTGCLAEFAEYDSTGSRRVDCQIIWDFYALGDLLAEWDDARDNGDVSDTETGSVVWAAFDNLFPGLAEKLDIPEDEGFGRVWRITGSPSGITRAYRELATALDSMPSGDDDVFDYWPNAMKMLYEFSVDLDKLTVRDDNSPLSLPENFWQDAWIALRDRNAGEWVDQMGLDFTFDASSIEADPMNAQRKGL